MNQIVGVLELSSKYRYGLTSRGAPLYLFRPYDEALPEYVVGSTHRDTNRNQIALIECSQNNTNEKIRGTLVRLIGPVGDYAAEKEALLIYYCPFIHKTVQTDPDTSDDEHRQLLDAENGWTTFHIDPPGCRDIDDAIAYNRDTKVWAITIADVAASIPVKSSIDCTAAEIGSTFYSLEGQVLRPMLPATISEGSASLIPGQRRRGLTLFIDPDGTERFGLTWITVDNSFTYDSFVGSALAFDLEISREPHAWIESLMIRYNRAVADRFKMAATGILRVQPAASADKIAAWAAISPELANEAAIYEVASTESQDQAHASLGLAAYCHASSPLRRYADLVNQRVLKALLKGQQLLVDPDLIEKLNSRGKANKRWGRDLTFLTHVVPGRVHEIAVVWASADQVWVPTWKRLIRIRHDEVHEPGYKGMIQIFCDPTKRNWTRRILTASNQNQSGLVG